MSPDRMQRNRESVGLLSVLKHDKIRTTDFPSTSKSCGCWDPLQILVVQDGRSESINLILQCGQPPRRACDRILE